ncbi:MAG TPA: hypothetical protein PKN87_06550 [Syntrophomonadaceae bacterium]|nr:hypothetical protein [Syntrophomonadaceae bacterium]HNX29057.1 hypothetical protein [Syntrophomonadaceae bacterium]HPR92764.1 hypothetical protein [Syntrophomonadaceae bacterium]
MGRKNMLGLIPGWAMLTALAITVAAVRIITKSPYHISLIIAVLMLILLIYLFILRKIDGTSFIDSVNDERLRQISVNAQRNAFWFLFISIWGMAVALEFFDPVILKQYISLFLAAIGTIGLFIYMLCFVWQKYRVDD